MDICNRDASDQESQTPSPNKAGSKKRPHGPEGEDNGEAPKQRRRRLPSSKREWQEGQSSSSPNPVATNPSSTKPDYISDPDDNETESADDASPPTARPRMKKTRRPPGKGQHNLVEQKYRQKLNSHFKRLLEVLPAANSTGESGKLRKPPPSVPSPPLHLPPFLSPPSGGREVPSRKPLPSVPPPPQPLLPPGGSGAPNSSQVRIPLPPLTLTSHEPVVVSARGPLPEGAAGKTRSSSSGSGSEHDAAGTGGGFGERRVSKGEVLERARLYIQALEQRHRRLVAEKMELELLWEQNYKCKETGSAGRQVPN
ncbi:uncharacterized protein B0T15DRAFT_492915 [Chaetomium strumarium]|uniref:BHLH domain-containing protein n=1 Tax=Chaetomium strumarium TaxID=1170767 RepID=A0AAJ0GWH3_9PEZI|nr:hypothetical protein B0T15DRAFT_492915 [Chaetomium strumarium]